MSRIIGFNLSHDSSIALIDNGVVRAAAALERTSRLKRGVVADHAYAAAMTGLTREVLAGEGLSPDDIDHWITTSTESCNQADEDGLADILGLLVPENRRLVLPHPGHHLAHASAAFYPSGFNEAVALVIDSYGSRIGTARERETGFLFRRGQAPSRVLHTVRDDTRIAGWSRGDGSIGLPGKLSGIGEIYRVVTLALGFYERGTYDDAGKTMGLAPYGSRLSSESMFIDVTADGLRFDHAADSLVALGLAVRESDGLRLVPRRPGTPLLQMHQDIAAQVQAEFEEACLHLVRTLVADTGVRSLVLGGGCFLNSVLNDRLLREAPIDRLFVFPAATDDGNAAGAALYAHHVLTGGTAPTPQIRNVYLGPPRLAGRDITTLAEDWGLEALRHDTPRSAAKAAAHAIADGDIIGWFQDRGEFGPRALGARSILGHPGLAGMKDILNTKVKFREAFRPFAGAVLAEQAGNWFDSACAENPFMLMVWPVIEAVRDQISEIVHVDGTCRVQTVDPDLPGTLRALLEEFHAHTGLPVLLNTSLNLRGMPIVERPEDALDCLYGSRLTSVFLGDIEVHGPDHTALHPIAVHHPDPSEPTGFLTHADGTVTMRQIAARLCQDKDALVDVALDLRRLGDLRWAEHQPLPKPLYPLPQYAPWTEPK